jgi:hypothetical protein
VVALELLVVTNLQTLTNFLQVCNFNLCIWFDLSFGKSFLWVWLLDEIVDDIHVVRGGLVDVLESSFQLAGVRASRIRPFLNHLETISTIPTIISEVILVQIR